MFQPIRRILPKAIETAGIVRQVTAARVLEETAAVFLRLWGAGRAAYVEPVSFADGNVKLRVTAPAALQECKLQEVRIMNEINRNLGSRVVYGFRYE